MEGLGVKSQANSTNRVLEAIYMVADIMSKVLQAIFFMQGPQSINMGGRFKSGVTQSPNKG